MKDTGNDTGNILVIADTHLPFEHRHYLDFVRQVQHEHRCSQIVHIGDLVDLHSLSYHEHDPDGRSAGDEMRAVDRRLQRWFAAFPRLRLCLGNHDRLPARQAFTAGLPERCQKSFREIWQLPDGWIDGWDFTINSVRFVHGVGYGGRTPHILAAQDIRCSTVIGHLHSVAGVEYISNGRSTIFGMAVGCGVDGNSYSQAYARNARRKPVLGCGVVLDVGKVAQFVPFN